jgi:DinB superfamily
VVIEPDTKDWTWVLHRRCPECGYDAQKVKAVEVADPIRSGAREWVLVLHRPAAGHRATPSRWSALEYGCHVRDVCALYLERLDLMLTTDDPLFANWDQDATALERRYGEQDPGVVTSEILEASDALASRLDTVRSDEWRRPGRRSDGASFTVDSFVRYMLHDLVHHLWDVREAG